MKPSPAQPQPMLLDSSSSWSSGVGLTAPILSPCGYRTGHTGHTAPGLSQAEFTETVDGSPIGVDIIEGCSHTRQAHQSASWIWRTHSVSSGEQLNPDPNIGGVVTVTCALSGTTKLSAVSQQCTTACAFSWLEHINSSDGN
jgi:hypothetical protein